MKGILAMLLDVKLKYWLPKICSKSSLVNFLAIMVFNLIFLPVCAQTVGKEEDKNSAENINMVSFELLENDLTANTHPNIVIDNNGEKAALIKIETTQKGFTFNTGSLGVVKVVEQNNQHPAEIWLYVPRGVKRLTLQHPVLGKKEFDLNTTLQSSKTYLLKLTTNQVNQLVLDYENTGNVRFEIYPENATLMVNGISIPSNNSGHFSQNLPLGNHTYHVAADNYYPADGNFTVGDTGADVKIRLKQNFGYLSIPAISETQGAEVFIDNVYKGTLPIEELSVKSGKHTLTVNKKLYKPFETTFEMTDSAFLSPQVLLTPNFAVVDFLLGDKEASVYDNGKLIEFAPGSLSTRLEDGIHLIEVKKPSHESTSKTIKVETGVRQSVGLESPKPIYGFLSVESDPRDCLVTIDGKNFGSTPLNGQRILIGEYNLEVSKPGFKTETRKITVQEGKTVSLNVKLNGYCTSWLNTDPTLASVFVDNHYEGLTPHQLNLFTGEYDIRIQKEGYVTYHKKMKLSAETSIPTVKLHRNYIKSTAYYLQAGYKLGGLSGLNFGAGFYVKNVNLEANYILSFLKSDPIFWNPVDYWDYPFSATYKPWAFNIKAGYGVGFAGRIRLTPQAGMQMTVLKENPSIYLKNANAISLSFGAKLEVVPVAHLAIAVVPEYLVEVSRSEGFELISNLSSKIGGCSKGFGLNFNVSAFF